MSNTAVRRARLASLGAVPVPRAPAAVVHVRPAPPQSFFGARRYSPNQPQARRGGGSTMRRTSTRRRWVVVAPVAVLAALALSAAASATRSLFFEETASAFWAVPYECADGSVVQGTLLVQTTRDFESRETEDPDPAARVQFLAVCPDGTSFSWGAPTVPATITSARNLKSVTAAGSGIARDNVGGTHQVSLDVTCTGVGPRAAPRRGAAPRPRVESCSTASSSSTERPTTPPGPPRSSGSTPRSDPEPT